MELEELTSEFASTSEILSNSRPLFHSPHLSYNVRSCPCAVTLLLTVHLWPPQDGDPGLPSSLMAHQASLCGLRYGHVDPWTHLAFPDSKPLHILSPPLGSLSHNLSFRSTPTYPIGPLWERALPPESLLWLSPSSWGISAVWLPSTLAFPYHHS